VKGNAKIKCDSRWERPRGLRGGGEGNKVFADKLIAVISAVPRRAALLQIAGHAPTSVRHSTNELAVSGAGRCQAMIIRDHHDDGVAGGAADHTLSRRAAVYIKAARGRRH